MSQARVEALTGTTPAETHESAAPRADIYGPIHKALRRYFGHVMLATGSVDVHDDAELQATCALVEEMLGVLRGHLRHENDFLHAAVEARAPGSSARTAADHKEHEEAIAALASDVAILRTALPATRQRLADRLYRHVALFVAENLEHMHVEETALTQQLWASYSDAELHAIHDALVASLAPAEHEWTLRWMLPSINASERAGMLMGMRAGMPADAFAGVLQAARGLLEPRDWDKLAKALGSATH
ncbi:MAG: hypothetical protein EPO01_20430 [Aquabacterium sp.]|nr:MAG: hypothetical protein EPO01_20430 [Aquabacterium sp.]